jgi:ABC-type branched-subunit amino acid transport system substrate-binding protein
VGIEKKGGWRRFLTILLAMALLAAGCGDDDDEGDQGAAPDKEGSESTDIGERINTLIGPGGPDADQGVTWELGAVLPLSGPGSFYGKVMKEGTVLALRHIKEAGGPDIKVTYKDHKSGNPEAGAAATRELGEAGHHAVLGSYLADFGAMLPGLEQYQMLSLDGGGGTGVFFQGKPFFWGTRGITPDDSFAGTYQWVKEKMPDTKRVAFVIWDAGEAYVKATADNLKKELTKQGMELVGVETAPIGATDYASIYARLKGLNPDLIQLAIWGPDPGYFMKGYTTS